MERQTLEKLDQVLNNLESVVSRIMDKGHENIDTQDAVAIETLVMSSMSVLDDIVPRPLPPTMQDMQNEIESLKKVLNDLNKRLEQAEKVTGPRQNIG